MTTDAIARIEDLSTRLAIKTPVRVATTANITLEGLQTIDGVALNDGDRVLVKNQTDGTKNGIWRAKAAAWVRAMDMDNSNDVMNGTCVLTTSGTTQHDSVWRVSVSGAINLGVSTITWVISSILQGLPGEDGEDGTDGNDGNDGAKGDPGGNVMSVATFTELATGTIAIDAGTDVIWASGYASAGIPIRYVYDATVDAAEVLDHPRCCFIDPNGRGFRIPIDGSLVNFEAFGAPHYVTSANDSYAAFQAMQDYAVAHILARIDGLDYAPCWPFPVQFNSYYYSSSEWSVHGVVSWSSPWSAGIPGAGHRVVITFPVDCRGIIFNDYNTDGDQQNAGTTTLSASGSKMEGITLRSLGGTDQLMHGIWVRTKVHLRNCHIHGFPGNLLNVVGTFGGGSVGTNYTTGSPNSSIFENLGFSATTTVGLYTVYVDGADANACVFRSFNSLGGPHGAYLDLSFLGNYWPGANVHNAGQRGFGGTTYLGDRYDLIVPSDVGTVPGTNSSIWYPIGAGVADGRHPAWDAGTTYYFSGGMFVGDSANSRCNVTNPYIEGGLNLCHAGASSLVTAPNIQTAWTNHTPMQMVASGSGGHVSSPTGMGFYKRSNLTASLSVYASIGEPETGTEGQIDTVLVAGGNLKQTWRLKYISGYVTADFANTSSTQGFKYHSVSSTEQFGTGAAVPYVFQAVSFALGGTNARRFNMASVAPTSGANAKGEVRFNDGTNNASNAVEYWRNSALGTPGTWEAKIRQVEGIATVGDAAKVLTLDDRLTQIWGTALTADRAVTFPSSNLTNGRRFRIVRNASATGAFNLNIGTGPLKALATAGTWADFETDGSNWFLIASGSL